MRKPAYALLAQIVLAGSLAVAGCDMLGPDTREFVIRIDSIKAPGAVSGGAAFDVKFYGFVGPNGCYSFKEFRVEKSSSSADITVLGERTTGLCAQALVFLTGQPLTIQPPVSDPFTLRVRQPDGTILSSTIRAE